MPLSFPVKIVGPGLWPCRRASARRCPGTNEPRNRSKRRPEGRRQGQSPGPTQHFQNGHERADTHDVEDTEFMDLHAASVTLMRSYFVEVEKSCTMLAECTGQPLSAEIHVTLTSQGIIEHESHLKYLEAKSGILLRIEAA
jgi:hypothetical protein